MKHECFTLSFWSGLLDAVSGMPITRDCPPANGGRHVVNTHIKLSYYLKAKHLRGMCEYTH